MFNNALAEMARGVNYPSLEIVSWDIGFIIIIIKTIIFIIISAVICLKISLHSFFLQKWNEGNIKILDQSGFTDKRERDLEAQTNIDFRFIILRRIRRI